MRLKEDNDSWRSGGIKRRMYRQAPLTPEEEAPRRGYTSKKYKKKHVHTFEQRVIGTQTISRLGYPMRDGKYSRYEYEVDKVLYVCTGCGYKRTYRGW